MALNVTDDTHACTCTKICHYPKMHYLLSHGQKLTNRIS